MIGLSACGSPTSEDPTPDPGTNGSAPPTTAPTPTPVPIDDDVVLAIDTTATTDDGATLALSARVHQSLAADDPAVAEERQALLSTCDPGFVDAATLDDEDWGIVRVSITAQEAITAQDGDGEWPADVPVTLTTLPLQERGSAAVAVTGDPLQMPQDPAGEVGPCLVHPTVNGAGEASVALGIRYDFASADAQGVFWNAFRYGFTDLSFGESAGVTFTDCTIERTALADELTAPEIGYSEETGDSECSAGLPPEAI